jgi:transposase
MIECSSGEIPCPSFRIRPMLKLEFTTDEKQLLHYERYHYPHPRVRQKMEVLWLKSQGLPHREIARLAGVSENTLRSYLQEYVQGGLARLREVHFRRPQSELAAYRGALEVYFREHPPATVNEARAKMAELTGISRSPTQIRQFMKRCGMRCRKSGVLPAKGDPDEQAAYQKKSWHRA